jgi:hypothetical protein
MMNRRSGLIGLGLITLGIFLGAAGVLLWQNVQEPPGMSPAAPGRQYEATVYLPLQDNHGKEFPQEEWLAAIDILVQEFGGATLAEKHQGFWVNGHNAVQREPVQLLKITFDPDRLDRFRQKVREVGWRLGQESMYVRFEEPRVEMIDCPVKK